MKNFLTIFLLIVSTVLQGQDVEFLNIVNQYRQKNGRKPLELSTEMSNFAQNLSNLQLSTDSVFHSSNNERKVANIGGEIVTGGSFAFSNNPHPEIIKKVKGFDEFLKEYFGFGWRCPESESDVVKLSKYLSLYNFHLSPDHKKNLLSDHTFIGISVVNKTQRLKNCDFYFNYFCTIVFR